MRNNIICRDITDCRLECAPWSNYFVKSENAGVSAFQIDQNQDEKVTNWIASQISNRVILLGAPGAGKTTFIRLVSDQSKFPTENIATDGISITQVNNITFWDFGGQEVLFSTHKFFLVDRCQYILVVDLSKLIHENDKIRNECLKYVDFWMKEIHTFTLNHQHSPPVLFLGTHCDLIKNLFSSKKIERGMTALFKLAKSNHLNCVPEVFTFYKSDRYQTLRNNISGILNQIQINSEKFILKDLGISDNKDNENNNVHSLQFCILKYKIELQRTIKPFMKRNEFEKLFFPNKSQKNVIKYTKLLKVSGIIETYQFESTAASEIIFLDPKWLSQTFTSIISIQIHSSKSRRGFFTKSQIENNLKSHDISESIWEEIFTIFEMFHLMVVLPSGEYYVPAMLHTPKSSKPSHLGNDKNNLIIDAFKEKNIQYKCIRRKYKFSPRIPFEFIDKLIVKYLHFPGMTMHESTWTNDFYLYSTEDGNYNHRFYHLLIQVINIDENNDFMSTKLMISIFYPEYEEENNLYFSFFSHFIFQSPHDIATSPNYSTTTSIENISILGEDLQENPIGEEKNILLNFRKNKDFHKYIIPSDIKVFDSEIHKCKFNKKLGSGGFAQVYSGKMKFDLVSKAKANVVFKETRFVSFESLRNLINECMMMKIVENQFTIKLIGICIPSMRLLDSRKKIHLSLNKSQGAITFANNDEEDYLNHQILMIIEEAPWGDLTNCHEIIQEKNSSLLKLKIAFDVARGLNSLYFKSGVKLIHRDVKSQNIFIISLDENSVSSSDSVHAKLGDFGSIVVASPSYSQRIGNYQYTAPEALKGSLSVPYSREIDVYSFGILFWEILTGKIPFQELKENPNTCHKIEQMIIDGYRPSLDNLPNDIPPCIIEIIKDCWNSKPSSRPSLGKIISILTIILQLDISDEQVVQKYLPVIESSFEMKQKIIGKNLDTSFFSDIQIKGKGSYGLVMICKFHLDGSIYNVALKMVLNLSNSEISSSEHRKTINEFNILPQIQQHPNIVCLIGSFQCVPSDEMINFVDESIRDLCFHDDSGSKKKKFQFYILEEYEKTLESIICDLNEEKIIKYSLQLSSALLFLYNHNIVHLDLKSDNLMISHNDDLIIVDFGVAGKMDLNGQVQYSQTHGGNMIHLSPEVLSAKCKKINLPCKNQHSWELGMIMFQMFSKGKLPFENYSGSFSFPENCIDVSIIPNQYRDFISSLLCPSEERLSIGHAHEFLSQINS